MENTVTPVKADIREKLLKLSRYNSKETEFLVNGFRHGFDIGYEGRENVRITAPNLKFRNVRNATILWNKMMKEVKEGRYAGPFEKLPFENYIQSHTKYPDFNDAIQLCLKQGKGCHIAKSDMQSAFRNLGISKKHWKFLVMKAVSPLDGKTYYFVDKCLPFGASISCAHFQRFSNAVAHIVKWRTKSDLVNYLDDYMFAQLIKLLCNNHVREFLQVCKEISFPVSLEKTFWATTKMVFLGLLIDTINQRVCIPVDKVQKATQLIQSVLDKQSQKITLNQLQKICGFLNFLGRCVIPGRAFTRRLYAYTANDKLKPHHHIRVNAEMKQDLEMWLTFLQHPAVYCRPFLDFEKFLVADEIDMFSDASGKLGMGAFCGSA